MPIIFHCGPLTVVFNSPNKARKYLANLVDNDFVFSQPLPELFTLEDFYCIYAHPRLLGGKGGYGNLLKTQKFNKKAKNIHTLACRNIYGQRLGDLKTIQKLEQRISDLKSQRAQVSENSKLPKSQHVLPLNSTIKKQLSENITTNTKSIQKAVVDGFKRQLEEESESESDGESDGESGGESDSESEDNASNDSSNDLSDEFSISSKTNTETSSTQANSKDLNNEINDLMYI